MEEKCTAEYAKAMMLPLTSNLLLSPGQDISEGHHREGSCPHPSRTAENILEELLSAKEKGLGKRLRGPQWCLICPVGLIWMMFVFIWSDMGVISRRPD